MVGDLAVEKQKNLDIVEKLTRKNPVLDVNKAANAQIASEQLRFVWWVLEINFCVV